MVLYIGNFSSLEEDFINAWYENDIFQKSGRCARGRKQAKKNKGNDHEFSHFL